MRFTCGFAAYLGERMPANSRCRRSSTNSGFTGTATSWS